MFIPNECYALNNMTIDPKTKMGEVIIIKALETGFYKTTMRTTQEMVDEMNKENRVNKPTSRAMYDASMFGWNIYKDSLNRYKKFYANKENK